MQFTTVAHGKFNGRPILRLIREWIEQLPAN
jgi:hypothetical protein